MVLGGKLRNGNNTEVGNILIIVPIITASLVLLFASYDLDRGALVQQGRIGSYHVSSEKEEASSEFLKGGSSNSLHCSLTLLRLYINQTPHTTTKN